METEVAQGVCQYSRSKNQHPVLFYYWRNIVLFFVFFLVATVLPTVFLSGYDWNTIGAMMPVITLFMLFYSFCFAWVIKGSLVESVTIDNPRQEIRIVHYRLSGVRCERVFHSKALGGTCYLRETATVCGCIRVKVNGLL